jgi:hypothetical protein
MDRDELDKDGRKAANARRRPIRLMVAVACCLGLAIGSIAIAKVSDGEHLGSAWLLYYGACPPTRELAAFRHFTPEVVQHLGRFDVVDVRQQTLLLSGQANECIEMTGFNGCIHRTNPPARSRPEPGCSLSPTKDRTLVFVCATADRITHAGVATKLRWMSDKKPRHGILSKSTRNGQAGAFQF